MCTINCTKAQAELNDWSSVPKHKNNWLLEHIVVYFCVSLNKCKAQRHEQGTGRYITHNIELAGFNSLLMDTLSVVTCTLPMHTASHWGKLNIIWLQKCAGKLCVSNLGRQYCTLWCTDNQIAASSASAAFTDTLFGIVWTNAAVRLTHDCWQTDLQFQYCKRRYTV